MHKTMSMISAILLFLVVATGVVLLEPAVGAESITSKVDDVAISVPEACNLSTDQGDGNTYNVTMNNGQYKNNIGDTEFSVACNTDDSFAIYAIGYSGNTYGNTVMLSSDTNAGSTNTGQGVSNIPTGTATSGNSSQWAMKLTPVSGVVTPTIDNGYGSFSNVPATQTKVASIANSMSYGSEAKVKATYAVYVSPTQAAASYAGKVKYTVVQPNTAPAPAGPQPSASGKICYYANATDAVGTMGCQDVSSSVTLLASNFSRTGYGFAGWSDAFDYDTNTNAHFYGPQETITIPDTSIYTGEGKGLSLYAVWVKSAGNIQSWNGCSSLTPANTATNILKESITALSDARDDNTYAVARLADGNCWMIENLRLESTNSDNSTGNLAQGYGTSATYGNFSGLANAESTNFSDSTTANSLYYSGTQEGTASIDIGTSKYPAYRMPRYNNWNNQSTSANRPQNPTSNSATNSTTNAGMYSYGNYYTWHAAIADLTYNGTDNQSTTNTSLCPNGWHLPTGGSAYASDSTSGINVTGDTSTFREFYNLGYKIMDEVKTAYEDTPNNGRAYYSSNTTNTAGKTATSAIRSFPNNFLYSGYFNTSSAANRGSNGIYWSSTVNSDNVSYRLVLSSSNVYPGTNRGNKYYGLSIRCTVSAGT